MLIELDKREPNSSFEARRKHTTPIRIIKTMNYVPAVMQVDEWQLHIHI